MGIDGSGLFGRARVEKISIFVVFLVNNIF